MSEAVHLPVHRYHPAKRDTLLPPVNVLKSVTATRGTLGKGGGGDSAASP